MEIANVACLLLIFALYSRRRLTLARALQGLGLEEAHSGVFSELAVLYTKYAPEKLMEHIKIFWSRCNVTKVNSTTKEFYTHEA